MRVSVRTCPLDDRLGTFLTTAPGGSSGGVQVRDAELHLDAIPDAEWFVAEQADRIVGAYALVPQDWGWWRCHLTVRADDSLPVTRALVHAAREHAGDTPLLGACETSHVVLRQVLEEAGFDLLARTEMLIWSRHRHCSQLRRATESDLPMLVERLAARPVHRSEPVSVDGFWLVERDGELRAGARLHPLAWYVDSLGPGSRLSLPLLRLAGLDLQPLRFGAFVGTFGDPPAVAELYAGVLAAEGLPVALIGADVIDPRWASYKASWRGALGRALGTHHALVYGTGTVPGPLDWTTLFLR